MVIGYNAVVTNISVFTGLDYWTEFSYLAIAHNFTGDHNRIDTCMTYSS